MDDIRNDSKIIKSIVGYVAECAQDLVKPTALLQWADFKQWLIEAKEADRDVINKIQTALKLAGGYTAVRDAFFPPYASAEIIERTAIRQQASSNRKLMTLDAREQAFLGQFEAVLARQLPKLKIEAGGYADPSSKLSKKASGEKTARILNLFVSDTHIGARIDPRECIEEFNALTCSRRFAQVTKVTCDYKRDHRAETELHVYLGGDIIQGMLGHGGQHSDGEKLADQWDEALYIIVQMLVKLAAEFKKVRVYCTSGNHDRIKDVHSQRATSEKYNSYAFMLYRAVKLRCELLPNVKVETPRTAWVSVPIFNHRLYLTHGDTNLNPGNPGTAINVSRLEVQMNRINIGEVQLGLKPYSAFLVGHVHFGGNFKIPGGYNLITNPALLPKDGYGLGFGHGQACGQTLFESTVHKVVGDYRIIDVDRTVDAESSLDKFFPPYPGTT